MTEKNDKQLEAIGKILSLTRSDKLKWEPINPKEVPRTSQDEVISSSFVTEYQNSILRLYKRKYKGPRVMRGIAVGLLGAQLSESDMRWYSEVVLDITDIDGNSLWEFPKEDILNDLLKLVKYKTSGAEELINKLLNE